MPDPSELSLSVLDIAPVMRDRGPAQALRDSVALAVRTEALGYSRFWLAEHHNTSGIASSSPVLLVGQIAAATATIRVGSGGIMLPNHKPLLVAEQFGTLASLYPGRIDLGIGRAAGTDPLTARALGNHPGPTGPADYRAQVNELLSYLSPGPEAAVSANPRPDDWPPLWMLGSSGGGARLAGEFGLPFATAHHFSSRNTIPSIAAYRESFRPSAQLSRPYAIVAANVIVAETDEEAWRLAATLEIAHLEMQLGIFGPYVSPEEADRYPFTAAERQAARQIFAPQFIGSPDTVRRKLVDLLAACAPDEFMALTIVHDQEARARSYELLAKLAASTEVRDAAVSGS
jgi:luciferase family oxidoreductase group 1